jgi:hypothetical protein
MSNNLFLPISIIEYNGQDVNGRAWTSSDNYKEVLYTDDFSHSLQDM